MIISIEQLREKVDTGSVDTVVVAFPGLYGRLLGKRFDADFFLNSVAQKGTHGCNYLATVDMEMEPVEGYTFANWDEGYGDFHMQPDISTLRVLSWADRTAVVICDIVDESSHQLVPQLPRSILKNQIQLTSAQGYQAKAATELEYYLFRQSFEQAHQQNFVNFYKFCRLLATVQTKP